MVTRFVIVIVEQYILALPRILASIVSLHSHQGYNHENHTRTQMNSLLSYHCFLFPYATYLCSPLLCFLCQYCTPTGKMREEADAKKKEKMDALSTLSSLRAQLREQQNERDVLLRSSRQLEQQYTAEAARVTALARLLRAVREEVAKRVESGWAQEAFMEATGKARQRQAFLLTLLLTIRTERIPHLSLRERYSFSNILPGLWSLT